jgi:hypothetical protein
VLLLQKRRGKGWVLLLQKRGAVHVYAREALHDIAGHSVTRKNGSQHVALFRNIFFSATNKRCDEPNPKYIMKVQRSHVITSCGQMRQIQKCNPKPLKMKIK